MARLRNVSASKFKELQNASKGHTAQQPSSASKKDVTDFVKGFYKKNGKAMTQLAYE